MDINALKSILGVGAWTTKFEVEIPIPFIFKASNFVNKIFTGKNTTAKVEDSIQLLAKETSIPERSIETTEVWHRGHPFIIRGMANSPKEWTVTFYNQPELDLKEFFDDWIYKMDMVGSSITDTVFPNNYLGAFGINSGYMVDVKVFQLCANGEKTKGFKLLYAFPKNVSSIELKGDGPATISTVVVTFAYSYWEPFDPQQGRFGAITDELGKLANDFL
jgi:hypothetical protein